MALNGDEARNMARSLIDRYFKTVAYPYTKHHIDSYDQFMQKDLLNIIRSQNPILILKDLIGTKEKDAAQDAARDANDDAEADAKGRQSSTIYKYRVEIYVGGKDGSAIEIGAPTITLQNTDEVRILYPNEARLRNVSYASTVYANILVKIDYTLPTGEVIDLSPPEDEFKNWALFKIPIMLHSRYCILNNKPKEFLKEAGECPYDNGGYFIVDGAEKVLVTRQEQAFNTLYITPQNDPKVSVYASIACISAETRQVKRISFIMGRYVEKPQNKASTYPTIHVSLPFIRKPVPLFVLFRALGYQSDEEILQMIFPDFNSSEARLLLPKLQPSILNAFPFLNTYTAVQYIKTFTKGFSVAHVLDIIRNQLFIHMPNDATSQALFLGECVRKILRVSEGYDNKTDRDDTRNQRCLTSGFLIQELFLNSYKTWIRAFSLAIGKEYNYNKEVLYKDENFKNIFQKTNESKIFISSLLTDMIMKGFKGKWGTGLGEDKSGVLQSLSRLSYVDFMSHCRRVILDFDTSMKLTGPRKLHTSQYGYFCTSETPTGASIGIAKNLSIMTAISTSSDTAVFFKWMRTRGRVYKPEDVTLEHRVAFVPVYLNGGIFGYTEDPYLLTNVLKMFKRCGCLPYSVSISFSIRDRKVYIYMDAGRPLRPLVWLYGKEKRGSGPFSLAKIKEFPRWRDLVMGNLQMRQEANLDSTEFIDPLKDKEARLEDYIPTLQDYTGVIEYIDPYEQNESYIANNPAYITPETTHMEVHPSTIMSMMTSMIPFAPHNQSPRNQLSCSQSKQGLSIYATNWRNRFDNTAHVLCYGEMPITRTIYNNYLGEGKMAYGMNCILAIACWSGYNQEDGIVMNYDAVQRGMFRSMAFRSYEAFEEDDAKAHTKVRFGNPLYVGDWKDLRPGLDYSKLDDSGIIREGEYVDENTVIVGAYSMSTEGGQIRDASTTPQVWTRGRVEKVVIMVNNLGLRLVKIRVVNDRIPELGDKFCMTKDHEVLTQTGWKSIALITTADHVAQLSNNKMEFVKPLETFMFDHEGEMYLIKTNEGSHYVTADHRVYVNNTHGQNILLKASILYNLFHDGLQHRFSLLDENLAAITIQDIKRTEVNEVDNKVYCISVPSEVFLARRWEETPFWTGNSNRHGQKGTIGALLRGHDMPRTATGIVPDMIMNPHAIPSRMTIAQNLEQLLGKTAALSGAIGDGTAFMNDGSPQEDIGSVLEELGYEKHGNEVLYNGATGEQINAIIFIGPVYGMRLKHMVEDKWQARGQGRKEVRTHQPTGGRGAQGGLKIGEMDRDAIIGHAGMAFVKESFMERSDGAMIHLCISCGTVPIYNPKLNIAICPMCDGPVKYIGDSANNLEILPPLGRPKSKIVKVEMPYSTKLLMQEQETFLNLSMRFITTHGVQRLNPLEFSGVSSEVVKELPRLILKPIVAPAYVEEVPEQTMTINQLRSMAIVDTELDTIVEEPELDSGVESPYMPAAQGAQGVEAAQGAQANMSINTNMPLTQQMVVGPNTLGEADAIIHPSMQPVLSMQSQMQSQMPEQVDVQALPMTPQVTQIQQVPMTPQVMQVPMTPQVMQVPMTQVPMTQVPMTQVQQVPQQAMQGGFMPVTYGGGLQDTLVPQTVPLTGPMIAVRTDGEAMAMQGLEMGGGRPVRRSFRYNGGQAQGMGQMQMQPPAPIGAIRVTKME
jgi:DNA-directed RNA polymerase II subunit RPB2